MASGDASQNLGLQSILIQEDGAHQREAVGSVFTLVVWSGCLVVGIVGLLCPHAPPSPNLKPPEPVSVQAIQVELKADSDPPEIDKQPPDAFRMPQEDLTPAPLAVARPSPTIAFAVPVAGPVRVVPLNQAAYSKPEGATPAPPPLARTLTFGVGEGKQPAPDYPRRAVQEHQQGAVAIRFVVGENGQVSSAEATQPCAWPLLNEAALRTVREKWRFPAGAMRVYDIVIRFQITN